jgi:hypothetical protein
MTTAERRLSALEANLSPTERVRAWLTEAQAHGTFDAYFRTILAAGIVGLPLDRLARATKETAEAQARGLPRSERDRAVRLAMLATVFRFQVVLRTIVLAQETLEREALTQGLLSAHLALLLTDDGKPRPAAIPEETASFGTLRTLALARVADLHALGGARSRVEARYLDGTAILFPDMARDWASQLERSERLAALAVRQAELDGIAPPVQDDPDIVEARILRRVADHVEPALAKAHDEIGDGRRAATVALRWLTPSPARTGA